MNDELGVWFPTEAMTGSEAVTFARRIEEWGYARLWIGETFGRDPFVHVGHLGDATSTLNFATGIANVYNRHPGVMKQAANTVAEQLGGRFLLGLGVSSPQIVTRGRGLDYSKPLTFMKDYLDAMESALFMSVEPAEPVPVALAALGPKMIALAGSRTIGAHTYNVSPAHTVDARAVLGVGPQLMVEQKVILSTDEAEARAAAANSLKFYLRAPGYRKAWNRLGFSDEQIDGSDPAFLDAIVVWGDADTIKARVAEHMAAGATHVCIQPIHPRESFGVADLDALEALAPG